MELYEDPTGKLTLQDILNKEIAWKEHRLDRAFMAGYSSSTIWARIPLTPGSGPGQQLVMESRDPGSDFLEFFIVGMNKEIRAYGLSGDQAVASSHNLKTIKHRYPAFGFDLTEPVHIYVSTKGLSPLKLDLYLTKTHAFDENRLYDFGINMMFFGVGIFLFFYNFLLFIQVREKVYLPYLLTIAAVQMTIITSNGFCRILFPTDIYLPNRGLVLATYLSIIGGCLVNVLYFDMKHTSKKVYVFLLSTVALCIPLMVLTHLEHYIGGPAAIFLAAVLPFNGVAQGIRFAMKGYRPAIYFTMAWVFLYAGSVLKALEVIGIIDNLYIGELALPCGAMLQVITLSLAVGYKLKNRQDLSNLEINNLNQDLTKKNREIHDANEKLQIFNHQLESLVLEKTIDIRSILDSMEEGIFSVYRDGDALRLHGEHSKYLMEMLHEKNPAHCELTSILCNFKLSKDTLGSINQIFFACLNEERLAWELNLHLLPSELQMETEGKIRSYLVSWVAMEDEKGIVSKILVAFRDITQFKQLTHENSQRQELLEKIDTISSIDISTFRSFVEFGRSCIDELLAFIAMRKLSENHDLSSMFRLLHTLKGMARTYAFLDIANLAHECEECINVKTGQVNIAQLSDFASVLREKLNAYIDIAAQKLNIDPNESYIRLDQAVISKVCRIMAQNIEATKSLGLEDSLQSLSQSLAMPIASHLVDELNGLGKLSEQLGKLPPKILIHDHGVLISKLMTTTIKGVFVHLFRNSLDHGIETEAERRFKKKSSNGSISIEVDTDQEGRCQIQYADDGHGLNLNRLKDMLTEESHRINLVETEIMESIFLKGVSTKKEVSAISGRGMGMDAVRSILQSKGGNIEVVSMGAPDSKGFIKFAFKITLNSEHIYPYNLNVAASKVGPIVPERGVS
ncbi:MAG TPA: 7TM diverse intracellular signaling domain-containing protein [Oligoflexus sp.]|uniref:7TM diverse intracellular signaling domain-containing protein n=1 Tax=Oligoflexus sp. TaxID=1971216 RepID=UPI002D65DB4A|nr:7TM diverse intracellular signaling domain-containing protein [Oligoflexus sp.]HYX34562.1 7TM diverse intracellular signaling domain-containing protein [Oligoflexus sp.]